MKNSGVEGRLEKWGGGGSTPGKTVKTISKLTSHCRYGKDYHVTVLRVIIASNWFISGLYLLLRMTVGYSYNSDLIAYNPSFLNGCTIGGGAHQTAMSWLGIVLFMVAPLLINIVSYTLIIRKVSSDRMKSINSVTILTRSILICTLFTLSWMPSIIIEDIVQTNKFKWTIVGKWFFYLNCLTDPILYAFSSKPINVCLTRLNIFSNSSSISGQSMDFVSRVRRLSSLNKVYPELYNRKQSGGYRVSAGQGLNCNVGPDRCSIQSGAGRSGCGSLEPISSSPVSCCDE